MFPLVKRGEGRSWDHVILVPKNQWLYQFAYSPILFLINLSQNVSLPCDSTTTREEFLLSPPFEKKRMTGVEPATFGLATRRSTN